jgi:hypothetical protein
MVTMVTKSIPWRTTVVLFLFSAAIATSSSLSSQAGSGKKMPD